jgi:hypothetical protein
MDRFIFYETEASKVLVMQDKVQNNLEVLMGHIKGSFGVVTARVSSCPGPVFLTRS